MSKMSFTFERKVNYQMTVWVENGSSLTAEQIEADLNAGLLKMENGYLERVDRSSQRGRVAVAYYETEELCGTDENNPRNFKVDSE